MMSLAPVFPSLGRAEKKKTLKIHKKSRFQPNEKKICGILLSVIQRFIAGQKNFGGYRHFKKEASKNRCAL